jgi:hypothetical protein
LLPYQFLGLVRRIVCEAEICRYKRLLNIPLPLKGRTLTTTLIFPPPTGAIVAFPGVAYSLPIVPDLRPLGLCVPILSVEINIRDSMLDSGTL